MTAQERAEREMAAYLRKHGSISEWSKEHPYKALAAGTVGLAALGGAGYALRKRFGKTVAKAAKGGKKKAPSVSSKPASPKPASPKPKTEKFRMPDQEFQDMHAWYKNTGIEMPKNKKGKIDVPRAAATYRESLKRAKTSSVFASFADEMQKISASMVRHPKDTLDRRTTRRFRRSNPRILPAPLPSGKLVS